MGKARRNSNTVPSGDKYVYNDYANEPDDGLYTLSALSNLSPAALRVQKLPSKLYLILSMPEFSHIITWMPHGRSWKVLDSKAFAQDVMSLFFEYSNYESFVRLVNAWGFRRISSGPDRNSYFHERFLRGVPHLLGNMRRLTKKDKRFKMNSEDEPNFYNFSPLPVTTPDVCPSSSLNDTFDDPLDAILDDPLDEKLEDTLEGVLDEPIGDASAISWLDLLSLDSDDASLSSEFSHISARGSKLTPSPVRSQADAVLSAPSVPPVISFQPTPVMSFSAPAQPICMKNDLSNKLNLGNVQYQMMMLQSRLQMQQRIVSSHQMLGMSDYKLNSSFLV